MHRTATILITAAAALAAVPAAAQSRGEIRQDRREVREQRQDLRQAQRFGNQGDVRRERGDLRDARRELRRDRRDLGVANPYRPHQGFRPHAGFAPHAGIGRGWGRDDWRAHRQNNRRLYARGRFGANFGYRVFTPGAYIAQGFYGQNYFVDPYVYRLPAPAYGLAWVRHFDDVLLVDVRRGVVVDAIRGFFW